MNRRRLLAFCGSLLAAPGCVQLDPDASDGTDTVTPAPPPDRETTETPTRAAVGSVEVTSAAVQPGVVGPNTPDSIGVFDEAQQYLVVTVAVDGRAPEKRSLTLRADGEWHTATSYTNGLYRNDSWGARYGSEGGPLVFPLPETVDTANLRLTWPGGSWEPPPAIRRQLEAPLPPMAVSLDGPTTVGRTDDPQFTVSVANEGDRAGRYVLALNRSGPRIAYAPVARLTGDLGPGETWEKRFEAKSPYISDPPREAVYRLDAPGEKQDARLTISPTGAATETASE